MERDRGSGKWAESNGKTDLNSVAGSNGQALAVPDKAHLLGRAVIATQDNFRNTFAPEPRLVLALGIEVRVLDSRCLDGWDRAVQLHRRGGEDNFPNAIVPGRIE